MIGQTAASYSPCPVYSRLRAPITSHQWSSASLTFSNFARAAKPIPVKEVVIAMFEVGNDSGDTPGELQYWVERDHLEHVYPMPDAYHSVRMNDRGEMAILTGAGTAH